MADTESTEIDETQAQEATGASPQEAGATGEAVDVNAAELGELSDSARDGEPIGFANLLDVPVQVTVEVGRARMSLAELIQLGPGSLVTLDREAHEPADILVNGKVVARGEVVTIDGSYGVRITSVQQSATKAAA